MDSKSLKNTKYIYIKHKQVIRFQSKKTILSHLGAKLQKMNLRFGFSEKFYKFWPFGTIFFNHPANFKNLFTKKIIKILKKPKKSKKLLLDITRVLEDPGNWKFHRKHILYILKGSHKIKSIGRHELVRSSLSIQNDPLMKI